MNQVRGILVGLLIVCGAAPGWGANHVSVESKNVAPGATGVQIGVFIENDVGITALVLPLELRSATPGTYVTTAFNFVRQTAGRVHNSPLGVAGSNWPAANVTARRYAVTEGPACSGPVSETYNTAAAQIDFVSPDAVFHAAVSTGDPGIGEDITMPPGSDPPGTANASFLFTFNVTGIDGLIEIDTCCVRPANHLTFVDDNNTAISPTFDKGLIIVGSPVFPPVVSGIPDQTIDEGQSFAPINLDDYVTDLDDSDASMSWSASGQSELFVSISPARVASIITPNPNWFGTETIVFTAQDPDGNTDSDTAVFTVNPINDPPVLTNITNKTRLSGLTLTFPVFGSDIDNDCDDLVFSMANAPAGASLNNDGGCAASFTWPTVCLDSGVYQVTFIVSDGDLADSQVVQITIQPNPDRFDTNPDSLGFTFAVGINEPAPQDLNVNDPGCGQMDFEVFTSETWLVVTPTTETTPELLSVSIDTAGLVAGGYNAVITIRQTGVAQPESILVPVRLNVTEVVCICNCHGDAPPACDGILNIQSIVSVINVAFRGYLDVGEASCFVSWNDVNCDCSVDILDVVRIIDHVWRGGPPLCNPCIELSEPCQFSIQ